MKPRRSLSILAVFLMTNGSLLGSEPEKRLQVRWGELGKLIGGKKVALQLADGARVKGRVGKVEATLLTIKVKKSSNPAAYRKGQAEIPREAVSRIEARNSDLVRGGREARRIDLTVGAFTGTLFGSMVVALAAASGGFLRSEPGGVGYAVMFGAATGAAVLTYRAHRPKGITLIEILPDLPAEGQPKPTDKEQSSSPKQDASSWVGDRLPLASQPLILPAFQHNGIGAAAPSLVEQSRSERLRQQARRAVMRQGVPLHLPSLSERQAPVARYAED